MFKLKDEGYSEDEEQGSLDQLPLHDREELVYKLLASMPRSQIARVHRRLAVCVQIDIIAALPSELAILIFSHLSWQSLLNCALVSRRWRTLANDNSLWHMLCNKEGWEWKQPTFARPTSFLENAYDYESDDEGVGAEEDEDAGYGSQTHATSTPNGSTEFIGLPRSPRVGQHNGKQVASAPALRPKSRITPPTKCGPRHQAYRHSAPSTLPTAEPSKPNYKLLHQTHRLLRARFRHGAFRFSTLQTRGSPGSHTGIIYCLQLYTYSNGRQVLFTGSKDRSIREWDLRTGTVERVFEGTHMSSVLSLCVHGDFLASGGNDSRVCIWSLKTPPSVTPVAPMRVFDDHEDSVLCVRFDDQRLVSCSKDRTIRICRFPGGISTALSSSSSSVKSLTLDILGAHRAAVNAVAISGDRILSASGDKSLRLWDARTGAVLRVYEAHHMRGIAAIDFAYPLVLSGSSDCHLRMFDLNTRRGWSTSEELRGLPPLKRAATLCEACGGTVGAGGAADSGSSRRESIVPRDMHTHLVRSVALSPDFAVSGSYDRSIKVWDRDSGCLIADLSGKHDARVFCVGIDRTKIISCGEDQKICIWDVSYGIDTSFIKV